MGTHYNSKKPRQLGHDCARSLLVCSKDERPRRGKMRTGSVVEVLDGRADGLLELDSQSAIPDLRIGSTRARVAVRDEWPRREASE